MELSQAIKDRVKENASKTSCILWVICGLYCIYSLQHVRLFSLFSLGYFTLGVFVASLTFGILLYLMKLAVFYLASPPTEEPRTKVMRMFWLFIVIITSGLQWVLDVAFLYPIYITAKFIFNNYYF